MTQQRADLGFADALDGFDPADWAPSTCAANDKSRHAETREIAAAAGFRSREPQPPDASGARERPRAIRGRRTGRSMQLNLKVRPDTAEAFCAIADRNGWGLGETLEHAVLLLEREYTVSAPGGSAARG